MVSVSPAWQVLWFGLASLRSLSDIPYFDAMDANVSPLCTLCVTVWPLAVSIAMAIIAASAHLKEAR